MLPTIKDATDSLGFPNPLRHRCEMNISQLKQDGALEGAKIRSLALLVEISAI